MTPAKRGGASAQVLSKENFDSTVKKTIDDEIYYKSGNTLKPRVYSSYAGHITSATTTLIVNVPTDKSLKNISTITCNSLSVELRGISGYLNNASGYHQLIDDSEYTVTCWKVTDYCFSLRVKKSTAFTNTSNNTPISITMDSTCSFTFN